MSIKIFAGRKKSGSNLKVSRLIAIAKNAKIDSDFF
jgi:hypothetical protein